MNAMDRQFLVAVLGIPGHSDGADDFAAVIADQHAATLGKNLLAARGDQVAHEDRPLLRPLAHELGAAAKRQGRIGFSVRHFETEHRGAVFLLERLHLAAGLDHDHAQRPAVERGAALDGGVDDALGLCQRNDRHCGLPRFSLRLLCHVRSFATTRIAAWWPTGWALASDGGPRHMCAMPGFPPIAIERLVKIYKTIPAVDGISFTLTPGSITGLLGGNGAGKTTTIATIMGLTTPTSGRVTVLGAEMPRQRYRVLHRMNFESPYVAMPMRLTIRQNLTVFGMLYGVPDLAQRIKQIGAELDLTDLLDRPTG